MDSSVESQKESYSKGPSRKGKRQSKMRRPNDRAKRRDREGHTVAWINQPCQIFSKKKESPRVTQTLQSRSKTSPLWRYGPTPQSCPKDFICHTKGSSCQKRESGERPTTQPCKRIYAPPFSGEGTTAAYSQQGILL
jgi:hypothetical protein